MSCLGLKKIFPVICLHGKIHTQELGKNIDYENAVASKSDL